MSRITESIILAKIIDDKKRIITGRIPKFIYCLSEKSEKILDRNIKICHNKYNRKEVMLLNEKINEMIQFVKVLNKLMLSIIELAGSITLLLIVIKSIIQTF